jgi:hypothetical protein
VGCREEVGWGVGMESGVDEGLSPAGSSLVGVGSNLGSGTTCSRGSQELTRMLIINKRAKRGIWYMRFMFTPVIIFIGFDGNNYSSG